MACFKTMSELWNWHDVSCHAITATFFLWCRHMFCFINKTEICTAKSSQYTWCIMVWQMTLASMIVARLHISVLFDKPKICKCMKHCVSTCHFFFGPKTHFFSVHTFCDHYALLFYILLHILILLFLRFEFAQDSKNIQEMDKIDVQKWDRRNPFGKIRALLGVLRNFFGSLIERPYMQWKNKNV